MASFSKILFSFFFLNLNKSLMDLIRFIIFSTNLFFSFLGLPLLIFISSSKKSSALSISISSSFSVLISSFV